MTTQQRVMKQQRSIAPAPHSSNPARLYMTYNKPACAKNKAGTALDSNISPVVCRRNARERKRVKQVNNGFANLRQHIPQAIIADLSNGRRGGTGPGASKNLSKVDTLRMAVEYIRLLKRVIDELDNSDSSGISSFNSCSSSSSQSSSSSPAVSATMPSEHNSTSWNLEQHQPNACYTLSFQQQQMVSPTASTGSAPYSDAGSSAVGCGCVSYSFSKQLNTQSTPLKYKPASYKEYPTNNSIEDDELLDYILLWQEDL